MNSDYIIPPNARILITGSNGFIGTKVVEMLLRYGFSNLRCFIRPSSRLNRLEAVLKQFPEVKNVEMVSGDLLSRNDCAQAAEGVSVVIHLAAGFEKSFAGAFMNSALATRNLMDAFLERGTPKRFVNVSSFAVYSNLTLDRHALLDETCPLETASQERNDAYGFGKLKQEELVREYGEKKKMPFVILRPGAVFGPGKKDLTGRCAINTFGFFIHLGGSNELPLTYVDNCADAIALAGIKPGIDGETFNVVDSETMTSREYFRAYRRKVKPRLWMGLPYFLTLFLCRRWENYSIKSEGQLAPVFNARRCAAEWKGNRYTNQKLRQHLGWEPRVSLQQGLAAFLAQFETR